MPVVRIECLPHNLGEKFYVALYGKVVAATLEVNELGLEDESQVTVLMPADLMKHGLGEEIVITVELFENERRTSHVLKRLCNQLVIAVDGKLNELDIRPKLVEAWCRTINAERDGYNQIRR